jgi:hypothetical protein
MKQKLKLLAIGLTLPVLLILDVAPEAPLGIALGREAAAIVGAPMTPGSVAGVARRTTRRTVAVTASATSAAAASSAQQQQAVAQQQAAVTQQQAAVAKQQAAVAQQQSQAAGSPAVGSMVATLPAGCTALAKGGVEYQKCGNVYYRAGFQGNNLVYMVQPQP